MLGKRTDIFFSLVRVCLIAVLGASYLVAPSLAQQRVETTAETNSRIASLAKVSEPIYGEYKLGSGDLISIEVFDVPQLSRDVRIMESGLISLPLLQERVLAKGLTTIQLQEKLEELVESQWPGHLSGSHGKPEGTAQPAHHNHRIDKNAAGHSIGASDERALEVLSACGGITDDAGSILLVTRKTPLDPCLEDGFRGHG